MALAEEIRRILIRVLVAAGLLSMGGYFAAKPLLIHLQRLTGARLVAYGLPDAFFALVKLAPAIGLFAAMPYLLYLLLGLLPGRFAAFTPRMRLAFWAAAVLLFGLGVLFCLQVTLPYGIDFLLGYERPGLAALISVKTFVSFCFHVDALFGQRRRGEFETLDEQIDRHVVPAAQADHVGRADAGDRLAVCGHGDGGDEKLGGAAQEMAQVAFRNHAVGDLVLLQGADQLLGAVDVVFQDQNAEGAVQFLVGAHQGVAQVAGGRMHDDEIFWRDTVHAVPGDLARGGFEAVALFLQTPDRFVLGRLQRFFSEGRICISN